MCGNSPNALSAANAPDEPFRVTADDATAEAAVSAFIQSRINFERLPTERYGLTDFKLERMRSLLQRLGDPQQRPAIHLAGTKGKGSTAAMIASILQSAGVRVGLFTSPHIAHFGERMTVDGICPTSVELHELLDELRPVVLTMDREGEQMRPTFFEVLTAMAWLHFRNRDVELVVLETGLGGRLDATNVCQPLACIITSISRDHERLLGSDLAQIAGEKAGIIKPGIPVFSGVKSAEPQHVIREVARSNEAPLYELQRDLNFQQIATTDLTPDRSTEPQPVAIELRTPWRHHRQLRSPLAGPHQADNLALAVSAIDGLPSNRWSVSPAQIEAGLQQVCWPLRVEVIGHNPLVIVDAAHNVASITALIEALRPLAVRERLLIFASARDKDTAGMLDQLASAFDRVIFTRFVNNPRAVSRSQLEEFARKRLSIPWTWADDPSAACRLARETSSPDSLICATGSFFLAAEFRSAARS